MNFNDIDWKELYGSIGAGSRGVLGVRIMVGGTDMPDFEKDENKEIMYAAMNAIKLVQAAIGEVKLANDPAAQERARADRANILGLFPACVFVEEIPNGYCSDYCCKHLPWFIITTCIGRFKIGWRKRVMHLEWTETLVKRSAEELFPDEKVTKGDRMIHAYSYDDARRYIEVILKQDRAPKL